MGNVLSSFLRYLSLVAAAIAAAWGNLPLSWQILVACMVADVISGTIRAAVQKRLNSDTGFTSIAKKALILILCGLVQFLGKSLATDAVSVPVAAAVLGFFSYREALSVTENLAAAGVPAPQFIFDALERLDPEKMFRRVTDKTMPAEDTPPTPPQPPAGWFPNK